MKGFTYTVKERGRGTEKIDVCRHCRERLGLPKSMDRPNAKVSAHEGSLYRDDKCLGCGESATGGFHNGESRRDGAKFRNAGPLAILLNEADAFDVFVTVDAETEEVPVGESDDGDVYAKVVRQVPDSPEALHIMVDNFSGDDDREAMKARCEELVELLAVNGWDGAPRPTEGDNDDWEIWAVPAE